MFSRVISFSIFHMFLFFSFLALICFVVRDGIIPEI